MVNCKKYLPCYAHDSNHWCMWLVQMSLLLPCWQSISDILHFNLIWIFSACLLISGSPVRAMSRALLRCLWCCMLRCGMTSWTVSEDTWILKGVLCTMQHWSCFTWLYICSVLWGYSLYGAKGYLSDLCSTPPPSPSHIHIYQYVQSDQLPDLTKTSGIIVQTSRKAGNTLANSYS